MKSRFFRTVVILSCMVLLFAVVCAKTSVLEDTGMQEQKFAAQATSVDDAARKAAEAAARERALKEEEARRAEQERLAREKAEKLAACSRT